MERTESHEQRHGPTADPTAPPRETLRQGPGRGRGHAGAAQDGDDEGLEHRRGRRRRRRGRYGMGHRHRQRQQDHEDDASKQSQYSSPSEPPSPVRRSSLPTPDMCFINRVFDIDQWEAELEYLYVLVQITGTRPQVSPQAARRAIANYLQLHEMNLEISKISPPDDFVVKLPDHGALIRALHVDRVVNTPGFKLLLKPWSRRVNAEYGVLYHKVQVELEGLPLHLWSHTMAYELLRPYCSVESIDQETVDRQDLSVFRLVARTTRPELIPDSKTIAAVPEPGDDETPFRPVHGYLKYEVKIRVRRLLMRLQPDSPPNSLPPTPLASTSSDEEESPPQNPKRRRRSRGSKRTATISQMETPSPPASPMNVQEREHGAHGPEDYGPAQPANGSKGN